MEEKIGEMMGTAIGEVLTSFLAIVQVLRKQPNFDNDKFEQDLRELLDNPNLNDPTRMSVLALLGEVEEMEKLRDKGE